MDRSESQEPSSRVVSSGRVRVSAARVKIPIPGHEVDTEPVIELVREGDVVRAIDITCSCGRRIRVLCDYSEEAQLGEIQH